LHDHRNRRIAAIQETNHHETLDGSMVRIRNQVKSKGNKETHMRSTIGKAFWTLSVVAMMLSVMGQSAIAQDPGSAASPLIGTWQFKVTLLNCQTGDPLGPPPFSSLLTFARGGTLSEDTTNPSFAIGQRSPGQGVWETTTNPSFAIGQRSPGQGVWETTSHDVFFARIVAFLNFSTPGFEAGQQIIVQTMTYEDQSDQLSAMAAVKFTDTNGAVYRQSCAMATARRF
jgi:hypothetical protein